MFRLDVAIKVALITAALLAKPGADERGHETPAKPVPTRTAGEGR